MLNQDNFWENYYTATLLTYECLSVVLVFYVMCNDNFFVNSNLALFLTEFISQTIFFHPTGVQCLSFSSQNDSIILLGGQSSAAVTYPHGNVQDVGTNPAGARNEK